MRAILPSVLATLGQRIGTAPGNQAPGWSGVSKASPGTTVVVAADHVDGGHLDPTGAQPPGTRGQPGWRPSSAARPACAPVSRRRLLAMRRGVRVGYMSPLRGGGSQSTRCHQACRAAASRPVELLAVIALQASVHSDDPFLMSPDVKCKVEARLRVDPVDPARKGSDLGTAVRDISSDGETDRRRPVLSRSGLGRGRRCLGKGHHHRCACRD
jgi:hypothetical protein